MNVQPKQSIFEYMNIKRCGILVVILSILPLALSLCGVDFASHSSHFPTSEISSWGISDAAVKEEMFYSLSGSSLHALMEWTAVMIAFIATLIAFCYFAVNKDATTPIIGVALLCSGIMDAFHTLAAMRLIDAMVSNASLIPYTWTIARISSALIIICGTVIIIRTNKSQTNLKLSHLLLINGVFGLFSASIIFFAINTTVFNDLDLSVSWLARPYDLIPLVLYGVAVPFAWKVYKSTPTMLTAALVLCLIPAIIMQTHHTFDSWRLYDNSFNIAHMLKILFYIIPLVGLILDYYMTYRISKKNKLIMMKSENKLNSILNNAADGILTFDEHGYVDVFNPACEKMLGFNKEDIQGKSVELILEHTGKDQQHKMALTEFLIQRSAHTQKPTSSIVGKHKNNLKIPLKLSISYTQSNEATFYTCLMQDITDLIEKDKQLNNTIDKLKSSNADLEKFAYISSHDLKSPLRAIDSLSKWLQEDLEHSLDETNRDRLKKLRQRVERMEALLNDLLTYSNLGKNIVNKEIVCGDRLIRDIKELLEVPPGINIHIDSKLNDIMLPKMPVQHIFHNLINNSIKHHHADKGFIQITVKESIDSYQFEVKDDGPGISSEFHNKIFEMFQTLKPRDEVEGSGMGLAMVKKLVDQFGGRVWVESQQGKGASFLFIWPKDSSQFIINQDGEELP